MAATLDCAPAPLARASACYCYGDQKVADSVIIYLLAQIAGDTSTPAELAAKAKCYCFSDKQLADAVKLFLLCEAATAAGA